MGVQEIDVVFPSTISNGEVTDLIVRFDQVLIIVTEGGHDGEGSAPIR